MIKRSKACSSALPITPKALPFPVFLLPTVRLPFRRRRASSPPVPDPLAVPSLSSSPSTTHSISPPCSPPATAAVLSPSSPISIVPPWQDINHSQAPVGRGKQHQEDSNHDALAASPAPFFETCDHGWAAAGRGGLWRAHPDTIRCGGCSADFCFDAQIVSKGFNGRHGQAWLVAPPSAVGTPSCPALAPDVYGEVDEEDDQSSSGSNSNSNGKGTGNSRGRTGSKERSQASNPPRRRRCTRAPPPPSNLINIRVGRAESRQLATGQHVVADIFCAVCDSKVGWKYVDAKEPDQRYKIGKFILETRKVVPFRSWEDVGGGADWADPDGGDDYDKDGDEEKEEGREEYDDGPVMFDSDDSDECEDLFAGVWDAATVAQRRKIRACQRRGRAQ